MKPEPTGIRSLPAKPLGVLGRDEMNLAEFPITLLTDRVPKDQKEAVYQDEIYDERTGRTLSRRLTIQAGNYGLTTAVDDEVILALIQITKQKGGFTSRKVEFNRHELIQMLGWHRNGHSYDRILTSLRKWTSVYLDYENAWRDNRTKTWKTAGFHIIEAFEFNDSRSTDDQLVLLPSYILWNEVIFESFQAGYLKPLDYDLCMGLGNSTAKRMYRFLDKRFHHKPDWSFGLKEFAHEHIGLGRNYEGPAHLRRKLQPAIEELEAVGFLEPLTEAERFGKQGREWSIRFLQKSTIPLQTVLPLTDAMPIPAAPPSPLIAELVRRGVTEATAAGLVSEHPAEMIAEKLDIFDWMEGKRDKRIATSPAGYLVDSIRKGYQTPKGFQSRAERERLAESAAKRQQTEAAAREAERQRQQREEEETALIDAYWAGLNPEEQEDTDARALAEADSETLKLASGPMKRLAKTLYRRSYIRKLLAASKRDPANDQI